MGVGSMYLTGGETNTGEALWSGVQFDKHAPAPLEYKYTVDVVRNPIGQSEL